MKYSPLEIIAMASALHDAQSTSLTGSHVAVPTNHALLAGDMLKEIAQTLGEPVDVPDGYAVCYRYWDGWPICANCQTGNQNGPLLENIDRLAKEKCTKCGSWMLDTSETVNRHG